MAIEDFDDKVMFTPRIMWFAHVVSQLIFAAIGWTAVEQPDPATVDPTMIYVIAGLGTVFPLLTPLALPILVQSMRAGPPVEGQPRPTGPAAAMTVFILDLAFRETGAIFALVALFLGATPIIWAVPAAAAMGMMLLAYPTPERLSAWASGPKEP